MVDNDEVIIGMSLKLNKYKSIIRKLIEKEKLSADDSSFLKKEGIEYED